VYCAKQFPGAPNKNTNDDAAAPTDDGAPNSSFLTCAYVDVIGDRRSAVSREDADCRKRMVRRRRYMWVEKAGRLLRDTRGDKGEA